LDQANLKFENLNVDVEFDTQQLDRDKGLIILEDLRGLMNGGEFFLSDSLSSVSGVEVIWEKEVGYKIGELRDISIEMQNFNLYQPMVYSTSFFGEVILGGTFDAPIVKGNVTVERARYTESLENLIQGLFSTREIGYRASLDYPFVEDMELDINVQIPGDVGMENSLASVETSGTVQLQGSLADPVVLAQINIVDGRFWYFGHQFEITEGKITNESKLNPSYDITAETEIESIQDPDVPQGPDLKVQMSLEGSLNNPLPPTFKVLGGGLVQAGPELSQSDIISLLTLGATPDRLLSMGRSSSSSSLSPFLVKPAEWYIESQAEKLLNLKEFEIKMDPSNSRSTRLSVTKQLREQISLLLDVGYSGQQWVGLQYEMSKHFALDGEVSQEGDWAFDLNLKHDFP
jgi:hypothetical protein